MGIKIKMNTFEIMRLIGEAPSCLLNNIETGLLMRMALFGDREGKNIKPGVFELSKKTKICEKTIRNTLKHLTKKNVIFLSSTRKQGSDDKSCYEININFLQDIISGKVPVPRTGTLPVPRTGTLPVPRTGTLPVPRTGTLGVKNKKVPVSHSKVPVPRTGTLPVPRTGTPYTQLLLNHDQQINVELGANSTTPNLTKKSKKKWSKEIIEIFGHWQKVLNHPKSKLDENRKLQIRKALESGYLVEDLKKAIEGVKNTPWNMRENPSGELYDDIPLIFRNSSQIERFIRNFDTPPTPKKENVTTGLKSGFLERGREQGKVLDAISREIQSRILKKGEQQTKQQEHEANELK